MPMRVPADWKPVPIEQIDQKVYGRTVDAYRHRTGGLLIHHKWCRPQSKMYNKTGMWYVAYDSTMIRRRAYYGFLHRIPPFKWAGEWLNKHLTGATT